MRRKVKFRKVRKVRIDVSENFFKVFDKQRKIYQRKLGVKNLSQPAFTEILKRNNMKFPKLKLTKRK